MSRNKNLDDFMAAFPHEGLTFDDLTLVTRNKSHFSRIKGLKLETW